MGLYHALDSVTNLKYKLYFLTPNKKFSKRKALAFNRDRCFHLVICLRLILFHYSPVAIATFAFAHRKTCIRQQCKETTVSSCHRYLINTGVEKMNYIEL